VEVSCSSPPTTALLKVDTKCTAPSLMLDQQLMVTRFAASLPTDICPAAKESSTTASRSDIRKIQYLDSSAHGLVRRWRLIGYFPIHLLPPVHDQPVLWLNRHHGGGVPRPVSIQSTRYLRSAS
jgi:hypothetical protein